MREHGFANKGSLPEYVHAQKGDNNVGLHIFRQHIAISRPKAPAEGKHPAITYPPDHLVGMRVPHGGSCCAKCKYVSADKKECGNALFVKWNRGDPKLPDPALEYCCDLFQD